MAIIGIVNLAERLLNKDSREGQYAPIGATRVKKANRASQTQVVEDEFVRSPLHETDAGFFQVTTYPETFRTRAGSIFSRP